MNAKPMSILATISSGDLRKMSDRDFVSELSDMSPSAIDRFRRMRKLSVQHNQALDTFLRQHPDKRLTADNGQPTNAKAVKAKSKSSTPSKPKPVQKKIKADDDGYVQLWMRMRAWWDGVELDNASVHQSGQPKPRMSIDVNKAKAPEVTEEENRLQVIQKLWGDGNSLPGGAEYNNQLLDPIKLNKEMVIADLNAGLGGGVRHLAQSKGVTVQGFDCDEELSKAGNLISSAANLSDKATISHFNPERLDVSLDKASYDIIIARDFFCSLADRRAALSTIAESLKTDGSLVFTDFCLANRESENKDVLKWRQTEQKKPSPSTKDEYRELLGSLKFDVKFLDDVSDAYVAAIQSGWMSIVEALKSGTFSRSFVDTLMQEGQVWLCRSKAIESGQLRMIKCRAVMNSGPKRSLTDSMSID
jgi:SAM-dependent methyltransferase